VILKKAVSKHLKNYLFMYFLVLVFFVGGVAAGAFTVDALTLTQREELVSYFQGFFNVLDNEPVPSAAVFRQSLTNNLQIVLLVWILGITVIGIPVILLLVGLKGFIIGFSVGFLAEEMGFKGLFFALIAILPQNILIVPCFITAGVLSIAFSITLIKRRKARHKKSLTSEFLVYSMNMAAILLVIIVGALVEGYITPVFMKMFANYNSEYQIIL
jgi:stage II sporulation protein M